MAKNNYPISNFSSILLTQIKKNCSKESVLIACYYQ
ncbi:uncharacterized protein METZ01_LOCUS78622 [marine metagenome]|uniref:Uncharacterized protein n=1 Tax=marine metagenome TaxID=408172 RepID=A0A381UDS8_9ZZZZ